MSRTRMGPVLSEADLGAIENRVKDAGRYVVWAADVVRRGRMVGVYCHNIQREEALGAFLQSCRDDVPALLAEVHALKAALRGDNPGESQ